MRGAKWRPNATPAVQRTFFVSGVSVKPGENSKNLKLLKAKIQSNFSPIWPKSSDVVDLIKIFGACFFEHVKLEEQGFQSATILLGWVVGLSSLSQNKSPSEPLNSENRFDLEQFLKIMQSRSMDIQLSDHQFENFRIRRSKHLLRYE